MRKTNETLELCQKIMVDPIVDILENFSLEKSREYYEKWSKQWNMGDRFQNPADMHEEVSFPFDSLSALWLMSIEAHNLYTNVKSKEFFKWADWYMYWQNIVVSWHRLKTFDEWLHDGLKDAITQHYKEPEKSIQKVLREKLGSWWYSNTDMHLWLEWKIDDETLIRLGQYEESKRILDRDLEEDIAAATQALLDKEASEKKSDVTVLTLKLNEDGTSDRIA